MKIGFLVKQYLEERGVSQAFLARAVGVSVQTMNAICNDRQTMSAELYYAICRVLGLPFDYFYKKVEEAAG
ncbi:MAG: helix-turn-helix transcriptional regulator [Clostridia bacterium]|nr:helix-turn-helix transcriptional regulator [Clostridia bacterium]